MTTADYPLEMVIKRGVLRGNGVGLDLSTDKPGGFTILERPEVFD